MTSAFDSKKDTILKLLSVPDEKYDDLSPKGSVDAEIRDLVDEVNSYAGLVTTSSCSGRISVFLEGQGKLANDEDMPGTDEGSDPKQAFASSGGKGGGGRWLFVSHTPLQVPLGEDEEQEESYMDLFQLRQPPNQDSMLPELHSPHSRYIHLKFEPMVCTLADSTLSLLQLFFRTPQRLMIMHRFSICSPPMPAPPSWPYPQHCNPASVKVALAISLLCQPRYHQVPIVILQALFSLRFGQLAWHSTT